MSTVSDDLILRMKTQGNRASARGVDDVTKATKRYGRGAEQASKKATLLGRSSSLLSKPFRHLREEVTGTAKSFLAAGVAFGSFEGIKTSIETTDELVKTTVKLHNQFGLTEEAASGLGAVLQARGLQPTALTQGLTVLSKQLVAAHHGSDKAQGAFHLLGIRARDVRAAVGSKDGLSSIFQTVVDRMSAMHGSARKAALGQQLLGRASKGLSPLLQEGALGLKQQLKWAKEFGVTLDGKTVGSVEDMAAAQTEAQYAMLGLQVQIGRFGAPAMTKLNLFLADVVRSFRDGRPEGSKFARTVFTVGNALKPLGRDLETVGGYLEDHPRLIEAAGVAWLGYKTKLLKLLTMGPVAYAKGLITGRAYAAGFATGAGEARAGQAVVGGLGASLTSAGALASLRSIGLKMAKGGLALGIASGIAKALHVENADPLLLLHPPKAGLDPKSEKSLLHQARRDGKAGVTAPDSLSYFKQHHEQVTPDLVRSMSARERRVLGAVVATNGATGHQSVIFTKPEDVVVHTTIKLDSKTVAKATHRQAIKKKSTR